MSLGTGQTGAAGAAPQRPAWVRYLLVAGGVLTLLLLGASAGILIGLPGPSSVPTVPSSDSVDVGFALDMSVHHEQAVEMATWERDHTADSRLRQLAYDIESGQSRQIGHLQGWLGLWGASALPDGRYMRWMSGSEGGAHGGHATSHSEAGGAPGVDRMPGMASDEELRRLRASTGPALDALFLQLMLRHHEGGTMMLDYAARHAETGEVRTVAGKMLAAQTSESDYLRQLLAERGAAPLPN